MDSAACVKFFLNEGMDVRGLHVDYGQAAAKEEDAAARGVAAHYGIPITSMRCAGFHGKADGLIVGRNAFLVCVALMEAPHSLIALGIHSGTRYWDCSARFLESMQVIVDGYTDGRVRLIAPFLTWSKRQVWAFSKSNEVPIELTYSCETGGNMPCGKCLSCRDKEALGAS